MGQNETFDVYMNFIFLHNLLPLQKGELIVQLWWRGGQNKGRNQHLKFRKFCFSDPFIAVLGQKNILYQAKCLLVPGKGQVKQFNVTFTIICRGFFLVVIVVSIFHCSKSPLQVWYSLTLTQLFDLPAPICNPLSQDVWSVFHLIHFLDPRLIIWGW